jgi:hypothetical protein
MNLQSKNIGGLQKLEDVLLIFFLVFIDMIIGPLATGAICPPCSLAFKSAEYIIGDRKNSSINCINVLELPFRRLLNTFSKRLSLSMPENKTIQSLEIL